MQSVCKGFFGRVVLSTPIGGGKGYQVVEDLEFFSPGGIVVRVSAGWYTDGCSVPWVFTRMLPRFDQKTIAACIIHDALYMSEALKRKECDRIFREALVCSGIRRWKATTMYLAVRSGGWIAWLSHSKESVKIGKKFCKVIEGEWI